MIFAHLYGKHNYSFIIGMDTRQDDNVQPVHNVSMSEKDRIRKFIFENYMFGGSEADLDNDDSFLEKGIVDSTGILELIMFVEEEYSIEVADDEVIPDNFDSVNKLCLYITKKKANRSNPSEVMIE